jgi:hypothetical protein
MGGGGGGVKNNKGSKTYFASWCLRTRVANSLPIATIIFEVGSFTDGAFRGEPGAAVSVNYTKTYTQNYQRVADDAK